MKRNKLLAVLFIFIFLFFDAGNALGQAPGTSDKRHTYRVAISSDTGITAKAYSLSRDNKRVLHTVIVDNLIGSSSTIFNTHVLAGLLPSIITLPPPVPPLVLDANDDYNPMGTSTNNETPIVYTSSNPAVAVIDSYGLVHVVGPGVSIITATQAGDSNYSAATPVTETLTVMETQVIQLPAFSPENTCAADFPAGAISSNPTIPLNYTSSDPTVATISSQGVIHIAGTGAATITVSQDGNSLYFAATPQSQLLTVTTPPAPTITIALVNNAAICAGALANFAATVTNGTADLSYQWQVNGQNAGTNTPAFTASTLNTGDGVACIITSNAACFNTTATSNVVSLTVDPNLVNSVVITCSVVNNIISPDQQVTFTAIPAYTTSGTTIVSFQWQVNGVNVGTNSPVFTTNDLNNKDVVNCVVSTAGTCIATPFVNSNNIVIIVLVPVVVFNTFTPNGDGVNDTWDIPSLAGYINCSVNIFSRYGTLVYNSIGYPNAWDGTYNGKRLPVGTYYYVIDLKNGKTPISGPVTILR